jgi:hypothetical protein
MKLGEQIDVRPTKRSSQAVRYAKRTRRRAVRQAWKQRGEIIHDGYYHGWVS